MEQLELKIANVRKKINDEEHSEEELTELLYLRDELENKLRKELKKHPVKKMSYDEFTESYRNSMLY